MISMKKNTEKYGRGIFSTRAIKKDELIEEAPVIIIPKIEWDRMRESILFKLYFPLGRE
ncbi:hypothetical protein GCM10020331_037230 [Ectobacillus funiculus]